MVRWSWEALVSMWERFVPGRGHFPLHGSPRAAPGTANDEAMSDWQRAVVECRAAWQGELEGVARFARLAPKTSAPERLSPPPGSTTPTPTR